MTIEIRIVTSEEYSEYAHPISRGFGNHYRQSSMPNTSRSWDTGRPLGAIEDGKFVGGATVFPVSLTIPGGKMVPTGAVSAVAVQPTHRRRGILRGLMKYHLEDMQQRGEILSVLGASETVIYGRFGYGIASHSEDWTIERQHTAFAHSPEISGRLHFVDTQEARETFPAIVERACEHIPGYMPMHPAYWEEELWEDPEYRRRGATALFQVVYQEDDRVDGYVVYRIREDTVLVADLIAVTDAAYAALWRYCFDIDLRRVTRAFRRAVDEPLPWMLANPRMLQRSVRDEMWLRLVDVPTALNARSYAKEGSLVIEVIDTSCAWNQGVYELSASPEGGECKPTTRNPDLTISADNLAATYMGGVSFQTLARAARVEENTSGALQKADELFWTSRQPWWSHEL